MAKFAVYYIPPANTDLYRHGSEILGYDVRAGAFLPEDNPTRAVLPEFDSAWITAPQVYGFHVTTGYSLTFDIARLPQVEQEMEDVCSCFGRELDFTFTPAPERLALWGDEIFALRYDPNPAMLMLHTMLIARTNPLASSSTISRSFEQQDPATLDPVELYRVRKYYTPYMLDGWVPHFTLMMPYKGQNPVGMREALLGLFDPSLIHVESICLLVMQDGETHYRLHREYVLADYPHQHNP